MVLDEAISSGAGLMLLAAGNEVTEALIERLRRYAESSGVAEPIRLSFRPSTALPGTSEVVRSRPDSVMA